ncbi:MAG: cytochrome c-type biogenesis protein CcmH [Rhizobiales bacterium]|nr:cytochrome c-type biogenesis protein CcmH [Hyphomicrobiales bacterium]NRB13373.1 cytochrome c-type biogenesis protein CcmH [Hyphomicrobiales bacterium]
MNKLLKPIIVLMLIWLFIPSMVAAEKVVPLENEVLEQRAKNLSLELRCLVCQNQSIESSDADLAVDLKILVREQISQGKTDLQIKQFLVDRYGEFVLLKPLFSLRNYLLWFTPIIFLSIAFLFAFFYFKNMNRKFNNQD